MVHNLEQEVIQDNSDKEVSEESIDNSNESTESVSEDSGSFESLSEAAESASLSNKEIAKIRQSTEHKMSRKFSKQLEEKERQIAELEKKTTELSSPPNDESIYDEAIGWRAKNMGIEEYKHRLNEINLVKLQQQKQQEFLKPIEERTAKISKDIADFQPIMQESVQNGLIDPRVVLLAGSTEGGLNVLYDLAKNRSPKLRELKDMSDLSLAQELLKMSMNKNITHSLASKTMSDHPIEPLDESPPNQVSYDDLNFKDGYKEFKKRKRQK